MPVPLGSGENLPSGTLHYYLTGFRSGTYTVSVLSEWPKLLHPDRSRGENFYQGSMPLLALEAVQHQPTVLRSGRWPDGGGLCMTCPAARRPRQIRSGRQHRRLRFETDGAIAPHQPDPGMRGT
jgi:hypothetical protein